MQPSIFKPLPCDCCGRTITHPIWWQSDEAHVPLCGPCAKLGTETFTGPGAVHQAWAICKLAIYLNDPPARHESTVAR